MPEKNWFIYRHINMINGKSYIGQTCRSLKVRTGKDGINYMPFHQKKFYNAIKKYGWNNFAHEILETGIKTQEEADEKERYYIEKYDSFKNGYNSTLGGKGNVGKIWTTEERRKARDLLLKKYHEGYKHPMLGKTGLGTSMWGKHMSQESNEKRRQKMLGKKMNEEAKEKMRLAKLGKKFGPRSEEFKKLMSERMKGKNNPMYGKKAAPHPHSKIIIQYDLDNNVIREWESIRKAERETKIRHIGECCKHCKYHKTAGNYIWRYKDEQ